MHADGRAPRLTLCRCRRRATKPFSSTTATESSRYNPVVKACQGACHPSQHLLSSLVIACPRLSHLIISCQTVPAYLVEADQNCTVRFAIGNRLDFRFPSISNITLRAGSVVLGNIAFRRYVLN